MTEPDKTPNESLLQRSSNRRSLWGWGMAALYGGFALFILVLVAYASLLDYQLVEDNYYEKGIDYQNQIDKESNAASLTQNLFWEFDASSRQLTVAYPDEFDYRSLAGTIVLFRPSNARLDRVVTIHPDSLNRQIIDCSDLAKGKWKIKIDWAVDERRFYYEDMLVLE